MYHLIILLGLLFVSIFLEVKYRVHLYHTQKERITITLLFFVIGILWDYYGTARGVWTFPGTGLLGVFIGILPIEEYLFSLVVPFWILTVYKVLDTKLKVR